MEAETKQWARELKDALKEMEEEAKAQSKAAEEGAVSVTIKGGDGSELTVSLDGSEKKTSSEATFFRISPGIHEVQVQGANGGPKIRAVQVEPGAIAHITINISPE